MAKKYDLVVKTGEYETAAGKKSRWKTIGAVMDDGKGGMYVFIERTFNPAGVPFKEGSESIMVSCFEPKDKSVQSTSPQPASEPEKPVEEGEPIPF